jgi:hypothetical protein
MNGRQLERAIESFAARHHTQQLGAAQYYVSFRSSATAAMSRVMVATCPVRRKHCDECVTLLSDSHMNVERESAMLTSVCVKLR